MSTFGTGLTEGGNLIAGADLSAKQFLAVSQTSTPRAVDIATAAAVMTGILQNTPIAGDPVEVCFEGFTKAKAGTGGWTAGNALEVASGGALVAYSAGVKVAVAIETIAAGEIGLVRVIPTAG